MQETPPRVSRGAFIVAILVVALGLIAATAVALYPKAPSWEAAFNAEVANAVKVDTGSGEHKLAFTFDLTWQPSYTSLVCWGRANDPRLTQPSWNIFREKMNKHRSVHIGLAIKPWSGKEMVVLLTVRLDASGPITAQNDARETIELLRRHSPCAS